MSEGIRYVLAVMFISGILATLAWITNVYTSIMVGISISIVNGWD